MFAYWSHENFIIFLILRRRWHSNQLQIWWNLCVVTKCRVRIATCAVAVSYCFWVTLFEGMKLKIKLFFRKQTNILLWMKLLTIYSTNFTNFFVFSVSKRTVVHIGNSGVEYQLNGEERSVAEWAENNVAKKTGAEENGKKGRAEQSRLQYLHLVTVQEFYL